MKMRIGSYDVTVDDRDSDIYDRVWHTAIDLQAAIARRMSLPDYEHLRAVDGDVTNCRRSNIESVPSKGPSAKRMLIHYNLNCLAIRDRVGSDHGVFIWMSPEDFRYVVQWSWVKGKKYVYRHALVRGVKRMVYLHRIIGERMGLSGYVRFVDGDTLNCRRENLTDKPRRVPKREPPLSKRDPMYSALVDEIRRLAKEQNL